MHNEGEKKRGGKGGNDFSRSGGKGTPFSSISNAEKEGAKGKKKKADLDGRENGGKGLWPGVSRKGEKATTKKKKKKGELLASSPSRKKRGERGGREAIHAPKEQVREVEPLFGKHKEADLTSTSWEDRSAVCRRLRGGRRTSERGEGKKGVVL